MSTRQKRKACLAVLMTCYNRREMTLTCLGKLFSQDYCQSGSLQVFLVDDGCTDGTSDAVRELYPQVKLLKGNGELYWGGGMRLAFSEAMQEGHDFYLWLNDDTFLYPDALRRMFETFNALAMEGDRHRIVVGATCDSVTGQVTYSGVEFVRMHWWSSLARRYRYVLPGENPIQCETLSGNCALIPQEVAQKVGNLDPAFRHFTGDTDYGLRARKAGCSVWIMPHYAGTCRYNDPIAGTWRDANKSYFKRLAEVNKPNGWPLDEWIEFLKRYEGIAWPFSLFYPYRYLFPGWMFITRVFRLFFPGK